MTDPAALTDEELAAEERGHVEHRASEGHHSFCRRCSFAWPCPTSRLIAALRAESAEVERLRAALEPGKASTIVAAMFAQAERLGHDPYSSKHALTYLVEEVERLREDARENYARAEQAEQELVACRARLASSKRNQ